MRFLANENFPGTAVTALIAAGHDVVWARNAAPGISDADVLAWLKASGDGYQTRINHYLRQRMRRQQA